VDGLAGDVDGGEAVEAFEARGAVGPVPGSEGRIRDHLARGVAHVELLEVRGQHAVRGIGLDVDAFDAAALDEVVDEGAAEGGADRAVDGSERHAEGAGLVPIHVDAVLGRVLLAVGADLGEDGALGGHAEELIAGFHELGVAEAAAVEQLEIEALAGAELHDGGWRDGEDHGVADLREAHHRALGDGCDLEVGGGAELPVL